MVRPCGHIGSASGCATCHALDRAVLSAQERLEQAEKEIAYWQKRADDHYVLAQEESHERVALLIERGKLKEEIVTLKREAAKLDAIAVDAIRFAKGTDSEEKFDYLREHVAALEKELETLKESSVPGAYAAVRARLEVVLEERGQARARIRELADEVGALNAARRDLRSALIDLRNEAETCRCVGDKDSKPDLHEEGCIYRRVAHALETDAAVPVVNYA